MWTRNLLFSLFLLLLVLAPAVASSQVEGPIDYETARLERRLAAQRCSSPIAIDGVLDEANWQSAQAATHFIQNNPREGEPATYDTEVRVLYDDENLYIGVTAYDDEPDKIVINDLTRDFNAASGDVFGVAFDTFHDRRNGFFFETNPRGAKYDAQFFNEGREWNQNWDAVWHVESRITEEGWVTEIAIPLKTLRFRDQPEQTWGVNFLRRIRRLNEDSYWSPLFRIHRINRVSLAGTLEELKGLPKPRDIKVTPYVKGNVTDEQGHRDTGFTGGGDAKLAVGTGLSLDLTLNTDFSQVEADVQQVNLTRFSLFFPEKRRFFLENSGIFRFGPPPEQRVQIFQSQYGALGGGSAGLRGGQSRGDDLLLFFSRRIGLAEEGEVIPVLGGSRFTGRAGGNYELGFLNIQTREKEGVSNGDNFTVMRVKRNVLANSDVGVMFINRNTMDSSHYNRSYGTDANFRLSQEMDVSGYVAKTTTPGLEGDDLAWRAAWTYNGRLVEARTALSSLGDNFNPEVGFAPRIGVRRSSNFLGYHYRQSWWSDVLREINPHVEFEYFTNQEGVVASRYLNLHLALHMQNGGRLEGGVNSNLEQTFEPFEIHPTTTIEPGFFTFKEYFTMLFSDPSRTLSAMTRISTGDFYSGTRQSVQLGGALKLGEKLSASVTWAYNDIDLEEGSFTTHLLTSRINYSFSTNMFLNALVQYNSIDEEWSSNVRFNIIHRPLSDLYVVYNDLRDELGRLVDRSFIVKFTYLLDL